MLWECPQHVENKIKINHLIIVLWECLQQDANQINHCGVSEEKRSTSMSGKLIYGLWTDLILKITSINIQYIMSLWLQPVYQPNHVTLSPLFSFTFWVLHFACAIHVLYCPLWALRSVFDTIWGCAANLKYWLYCVRLVFVRTTKSFVIVQKGTKIVPRSLTLSAGPQISSFHSQDSNYVLIIDSA